MAASTTPGPLDPAPDAPETALAARWRRLREGVPPALFLLACAISGSRIDKPDLEETIRSLETFLDSWRARIQPLVDMV